MQFRCAVLVYTLAMLLTVVIGAAFAFGCPCSVTAGTRSARIRF